MEEKDIKVEAEETEKNETENLEEKVEVSEENKEENKVEEAGEEVLPDSSIEITKIGAEEKQYDQEVEEERQALIAQSKRGNRISTISIILVMLLSISGIIFLNSIPVLSYVFMGVAVAVLIVFSIITHRIARPDVKGYIVKASTAVNRFTFNDTRFSEVKYDPNDKVELGDVSSDGVYDGIVRTASRNVVEGKYLSRSFKVCELALFKPNVGKKQDPAFIGKYLVFPNDLRFENRIVIVSKGEKDTDIPTGLSDLTQLENNEKFFIYGPNQAALKELGSKFISEVKKINVANHLLNLTIVIWAGKTIVYASYDDATITLPFYEPYVPETAVQYKENLLEILEALQLLLKE